MGTLSVIGLYGLGDVAVATFLFQYTPPKTYTCQNCAPSWFYLQDSVVLFDPKMVSERSFHVIQYALLTELRSVSDGRAVARTPCTSRVPVRGVACHTSRKSPQRGWGCS